MAFLLVPDLIMLALFGRGAFTAAAASAAAATLAAYAIGLLPFVLLRSMTATFLARGDTMTPVIALSGAVLVNVALKILLYRDYAQVGLAFATSIGAWVNFALLVALAMRRGLITADPQLSRSILKLAAAGAALAVALWIARPFALDLARTAPRFGQEIALALLATLGALVYGGLIAALFGRQWMDGLRRRRGGAAPPPTIESGS